MRLLFAQNIDGTVDDNSALIYKEIDINLSRDLFETNQKINRINRKKNPSILRYLRLFAFLGLLITIALIISNFPNVNFFKALFTSGILTICLIFFLVLYILSIFLKSFIKIKTDKSEELINLENKLKKIEKEIEKQINFPRDAQDFDFLVMIYAYVNGVARPASRAFNFFNQNMKVHLGQDDLYIYEHEAVYKIPKHCFNGCYMANVKFTFGYWNKKIPFKTGEYKPYHIKSYYGSLRMRGLMHFSFNYNDDEYEFLMPAYDGIKLAEMLELNIE